MPDPTDMTVFALMKSRMQMLGTRQKLVAENVANVSTPGYTPRDVDQKKFSAVLGAIAARSEVMGPAPLRLAATQPGHFESSASMAGVGSVAAPDSETTLDGNRVVVEEQMMKIAEIRTDFETMVGLYQKSLGLLRLAVRSPTR